MRPKAPALPTYDTVREHVLKNLGRYWPNGSKIVAALPIVQKTLTNPISGPLRLIEVKLPVWAANCGVDGYLLIPQEAAIQQNNTEIWQQIDWWLAAFLLLEAWHERVWEHSHGPIHSYSFRLPDWDERAWQHAWVNRIGLFLRQWALHLSEENFVDLVEAPPKARIQMTHDVDAVTKTLPIRLKQGAFNLFNSFRSLGRGQFRQATRQVMQAIRFLFGRENWWMFDKLQQWEFDAGICAIYHFHADRLPKTFKRWLLDPSYNISAPKQLELLRQLKEQGHKIGLHPGFETWQDPKQIELQRSWVQEAADTQVIHCRQHWLRFSWQDTWSAQESAGLKYDSTLMFNDRPGFRNSSALSWHPYDTHRDVMNGIAALTTVFMDSHFYDYKPKSPAARHEAMQHWIRECHSVGGEVALLWHPHTLTKNYGWADGFMEAISLIREFDKCQ